MMMMNDNDDLPKPCTLMGQSRARTVHSHNSSSSTCSTVTQVTQAASTNRSYFRSQEPCGCKVVLGGQFLGWHDGGDEERPQFITWYEWFRLTATD